MTAKAGPAPSLSLVIPAYNEEARLPDLLKTLSSTAPATIARTGFRLVEAVIVDDGSVDHTAQILERAGEADPPIQPILGRSHGGKGGAVAAGVEAARGEFVLQSDVDLSTPLEDLARLGDAIEAGAEIAIGSRDVEGSVVRGAPRHRTWLGWGFNFIVRRVTGMPFHDTQCGFKLFRAEAGRELLAGQICTGFSYDVELLLRAQRAGLRIAEVPVTYNHDSRSRLRVAPASARMLYDVLRLTYRVRREPRSSLAATRARAS